MKIKWVDTLRKGVLRSGKCKSCSEITVGTMTSMLNTYDECESCWKIKEK